MNVKRGVVKKGLMTGLFLQLAIGPVFFYIINLSLQRTVFDGLLGVLAVTIVDLFYISLALFGIGKLLEKNKIKIVFVIISSITLIIFGGLMIMNGLNGTLTNATEINSLNIFSSFISTFLLTIFNPMTIIFYTSLFTAKAIEYKYVKRDLYIFGLAVGSATFIFMSIAVLLFSFIKEIIPLIAAQLLNIFVGIVLIIYGVIRIIKIHFK